ncbi:putative amino-acid permease C11D3.08c [Hypsizygus marmoreus]|uniref:Amino-acid permease C11D3.08c n=1 Tax=Hypsizygus marmoreus TaxID=39966 RepID=A0A369JX48_HYPMA|nr:putative amino-acid permease C11D3.08c [Hypsizygus marmoreus]
MTPDTRDEEHKPEVASDVELLASLGYKQEFKRDFSPAELFGLSFSIIGVAPSVASVLLYSIVYGPVAMVWGWATCSVFLMFIAMAMAELGSSAPTSGGLYYWAFKFSSPKYRNLLAWVIGYINTIGYIGGTAGIDWGLALQIMAGASIGSNETFVPTNAQTFGVYCAILVVHSIIASMATKVVARLQLPYIALNILLCLGVIIGLPAATPKEFRNTAKFAMGDFENFVGWPDGYGFLLSFLAPLWTIGGFDTSVHISEEARNAQVAVPLAIMLAPALGCMLGWAINVALVFCMGTDLANITGSPIGQPMATILFNSFGRNGTLAIWSLFIVTQFMMGTNVLTAGSRQIFAFARDGALPFSRFLYRLNAHTGTPINCVCFCAFGAALLALLTFAGASAIGAVFTMAIVCQYLSYSTSIAARFLGGTTFKPGPFYLGRFSLPVAVVAVSFMLFMTVVLLFPLAPDPTAQSMNYTIVVIGGTIALCILYYFFPKYGGRYWFKGPVTTVEQVVDNDDGSKDDFKQEFESKASQ